VISAEAPIRSASAIVLGTQSMASSTRSTCPAGSPHVRPTESHDSAVAGGYQASIAAVMSDSRGTGAKYRASSNLEHQFEFGNLLAVSDRWSSTAAALQPSLFDDGRSERIGPSGLTGIRRTHLTAGAWIDVLPSWLSGADPLFESLLTAVPWRAERRPMYDRIVDVPRLVAFYAEGAALPHPALDAARSQLSEHYDAELGEPFATAGLCLYRDGKDSVAWHGDRIGRGNTVNTMVAILVLGDPRPLMLRPRGGGQGVRQPLAHGDLIVMGGSCQRTWEHAIPKTSRPVGPRISVQFRPTGVR
jgi:alkylated DNA repair dioxygenase AlkB